MSQLISPDQYSSIDQVEMVASIFIQRRSIFFQNLLLYIDLQYLKGKHFLEVLVRLEVIPPPSYLFQSNVHSYFISFSISIKCALLHIFLDQMCSKESDFGKTVMFVLVITKTSTCFTFVMFIHFINSRFVSFRLLTTTFVINPTIPVCQIKLNLSNITQHQR